MHDDSLAMAYESIQSWKMTGVGEAGVSTASLLVNLREKKKKIVQILLVLVISLLERGKKVRIVEICEVYLYPFSFSVLIML